MESSLAEFMSALTHLVCARQRGLSSLEVLVVPWYSGTLWQIVTPSHHCYGFLYKWCDPYLSHFSCMTELAGVGDNFDGPLPRNSSPFLGSGENCKQHEQKFGKGHCRNHYLSIFGSLKRKPFEAWVLHPLSPLLLGEHWMENETQAFKPTVLEETGSSCLFRISSSWAVKKHVNVRIESP